MGLIILAIYLIGIPLTFWLMGGFEELKSDDEETGSRYHEAGDRMLSISIIFMVGIIWPVFWAFCLVLSAITKIFGKFP